MAFAIKAEIENPQAQTFAFTAQKTMYGGKRIAEGDTIFVFATRTKAGRGLSRAAWSRPPSQLQNAPTSNARHHASAFPSAAPLWPQDDWGAMSSSGSRTGRTAGRRQS